MVSRAAWSGSSRARTRSTRPPTAIQASTAHSGPNRSPIQTGWPLSASAPAKRSAPSAIPISPASASTGPNPGRPSGDPAVLPARRFAAERSRRKAATPTTTTAARKPVDSRKLKSVPSKSIATSPRARPPASSGGRYGRIPVDDARPAPVLMSMNALMRRSRRVGTLRAVRLTPRRERRPRAHRMSSSRDIERYAGLFASRTKVMKSSAMRDLMAVTTRPEVISLAGGLPDTSTFPPDTFAAVAQRIASESCAKALQYGPTEGLEETKDCIAEVMAAEGMHADAEDMLVTTGGQQVLDLVAKTLIDPGDVVVAEGPTYPGAVPVFSSYQAELVQIDMDGDGMRVDLLEKTLDRLERDGRRPKFIYTVPSFQNPAGVTMSQARRHRLVEVAHERELLVLEDNPYGLLRYEGEAPTPLLSLDGGVYVMYLGTFSKILSPGIRLGWVVAPPPVLEKINLGKQGVDLCTSTLSQLMVQAYFERGNWRDYVDSLTNIYRKRRDTMLDALAE